MLSPAAYAEPSSGSVIHQHWLRLALPATWVGPAAEEEERPLWLERLRCSSGDLGQFLRAYAAGLVVALTFTA